MPGAAMPAVGGVTPKPFTFNSNTPGGGAQTAGYNYGLQNLQNALQASNNTTSGQQMQLGQQLQQNQANVAQNLTNRGLGNTTISQTMAQAPLQTYNLGTNQLQNTNALRQMGAYGNLAQAAMQGGNAISGLAQPYAQTQYTANMMKSLMGPQQQYSPQIPSDFMQGQAGGGGGANLQNAANMAAYNQMGNQSGVPGYQAGQGAGQLPAWAQGMQPGQIPTGFMPGGGGQIGGGYDPNAGVSYGQGSVPAGTPMNLPSGNYQATGQSSIPNIMALMGGSDFGGAF